MGEEGRKEKVKVKLEAKGCAVSIYVKDSDELLREYPIASKVLLLAEQLQSIRERAHEYEDIYVIDSSGFVKIVAQIKEPFQKTEVIAFANSPLPVPRQVFRDNGINDNTLRPTLSRYKDRFECEEVGGAVSLKPGHFDRIKTEVIPAIRQQKKKQTGS